MYKAISLFSGAGGDSLGMTQAGCSVIAYNELNKTFCRTHDTNFPDSELICSKDGKTDITKIEDTQIVPLSGKVDIIFAGFPCQGFSTAGKKRDDDPRNTLFLQFLRVTRIVNPYMIVGENVKGLLGRKNYIDIIVKEFEDLGYQMIYKVFKTEQFGVPQKRERLILLGTKLNNPYNWISKFPEQSLASYGLENIVSYNMRGAIKVPDEWFSNIPQECILFSDICELPTDTPHPYLLSKLYADQQHRTYNNITYDCLFSFGKRNSPIHCEIIDIRKPCKTIICTYEHQPRLFVPLKNSTGYYLRVLLPDELKQIQGFPKDYVIHGSVKEQIIQIGNAAPPPLIRAILKNIIQ